MHGCFDWTGSGQKVGLGSVSCVYYLILLHPLLFSYFTFHLQSTIHTTIFLTQKSKHFTPISPHRRPHKVKSNQKQQSWRPTRVNATAAKQNGPSNSTKEVISFGISFTSLYPVPFSSTHTHSSIHPSIHPHHKNFPLHSVKQITHWHLPFPPLATAPPASFSVAANPPSTL